MTLVDFDTLFRLRKVLTSLTLPANKPTEPGSCCKDLKDAMTMPQQKFLWTSEDDVLYLTVGNVETEQGTGWMDQAVLFCPFCGKQLQTRDEIRLKAGSGSQGIQ